mmetsp:Transcript_4432/g.8371  ORF Transcript_4432/g.8371 Transcript_4432/m.8371 type:complete len:202 (-) Transcript_4432:309-914(-)
MQKAQPDPCRCVRVFFCIQFVADPVSHSVGSTRTGFHRLELKVKHALARQEEDEAETEPEVEEHVTSSNLLAHEEDALSQWQKVKDTLYESICEVARANKGANPRQIVAATFRESEWSRSLAPAVQDDMVQRLKADKILEAIEPAEECGEVHTELPLSEVTAFASQDSFQGERENVQKLSRSKRSLQCTKDGLRKSKRIQR